MSDNSDLRHDDQADEAVQAVVDRVLSWQAGAPEETVLAELQAGLREIGAAMPEAPPLPPPVRELMRRNNTIDVYDASGNRIVGALNPGRQMREALLA